MNKIYTQQLSSFWRITKVFFGRNNISPAQNAKNEVEHEKGADDDHRHEVDPVERAADSVISLPKQPVPDLEILKSEGRKRKKIY